jgi:hypothetical protein
MENPEKTTAEVTKAEDTDWEIERRGLDRFTARPKGKGGDKVPTLVFERDGLGWDLVDIEAPALAGASPEVSSH